MTGRPTPHDFLLFLRGRFPPLARRLDGASGLSLSGETLSIRVPGGSWAEAELRARREELQAAARGFFGPTCETALEPGPEDSERLPLPVLATKVWNHVAFWVRAGGASAVLALRKPLYLERWLGSAQRAEDPEVFARTYGGEEGDARRLPELLDDLCALGRAQSSYVQLVTPFPGDEEADRLEGRLYAVKDWGTPQTPAAILQKYVGRLHYVSPRTPPLGIRAATRLLEGSR